MTAVTVEINEEMVLVKTDLGSFTGKWCSEKPIKHKQYILELDCEDIVTPSCIQFAGSNEFFIKNCGEHVILCGKVEEVEEGLMYVRVGQDILMLYILPNHTYEKYINHYVQFNLSVICFYNTDLC